MHNLNHHIALFAAAHCGHCCQFFVFNPTRVSAIEYNGVEWPVCRRCIDMVNQKRLAFCERPIEIPAGAYTAEERN